MSKLRPVILICLLASAMSLFVLGGCGGSDDSGASEADTQELTALASQINDISVNSDAKGFCAILAPSEVKATFRSRKRCTDEYTKIFQSVKDPQPVTLEDISVDGDSADVTFKEQDGAIKFVKEDGEWWLSVNQGSASDSADSASADTSVTDGSSTKGTEGQ